MGNEEYIKLLQLNKTLLKENNELKNKIRYWKNLIKKFNNQVISLLKDLP